MKQYIQYDNPESGISVAQPNNVDIFKCKYSSKYFSYINSNDD